MTDQPDPLLASALERITGLPLELRAAEYLKLYQELAGQLEAGSQVRLDQ